MFCMIDYKQELCGINNHNESSGNILCLIHSCVWFLLCDLIHLKLIISINDFD